MCYIARGKSTVIDTNLLTYYRDGLWGSDFQGNYQLNCLYTIVQKRFRRSPHEVTSLFEVTSCFKMLVIAYLSQQIQQVLICTESRPNPWLQGARVWAMLQNSNSGQKYLCNLT
jgi:hypothetical protein